MKQINDTKELLRKGFCISGSIKEVRTLLQELAEMEKAEKEREEQNEC